MFVAGPVTSPSRDETPSAAQVMRTITPANQTRSFSGSAVVRAAEAAGWRRRVAASVLPPAAFSRASPRVFTRVPFRHAAGVCAQLAGGRRGTCAFAACLRDRAPRCCHDGPSSVAFFPLLLQPPLFLHASPSCLFLPMSPACLLPVCHVCPEWLLPVQTIHTPCPACLAAVSLPSPHETLR